MPVTLKDIAKALGVSVGTVSRALNDKNEVSVETSERIRNLANELGYVPNRAGRALSAHRSISHIGILLPSINSPFFDDIKRGISMAQSEFKDLGLDVMLQEVEGWDPSRHLEGIEALKEKGCKAFALCTVDDDAIVDKICNLSDEGYPVLLINNNIPRAKHICFVGPDYVKSGQVAAAVLSMCMKEKLKVLIVAGLKTHLGHKLRIDGFEQELKLRGVDYEICSIVEGRDNDITTQQVTMKALSANRDINCIYMATGSGVSGLGAAIIANSDRKRTVVACDEIYTTRELVKSDLIDFVICQESVTQGYQAIKKLQEYMFLNAKSCENYIVDNIVKIKNHFQ